MARFAQGVEVLSPVEAVAVAVAADPRRLHTKQPRTKLQPPPNHRQPVSILHYNSPAIYVRSSQLPMRLPPPYHRRPVSILHCNSSDFQQFICDSRSYHPQTIVHR